MTFLTILSQEEILLFEHPPQFTANERKRFLQIPKWAEEILQTLQTPAGKAGFLLQLGYFRATKKFYAPDTFGQADIAFVAKRLSLEEGFAKLEAYPKSTLHRHRKVIRDKLGYLPFSQAAETALSTEVDFLLSKQMRLKDIFSVLLAKLEQLKVEAPSYHRLADLITEGFLTYEKRLLTVVENSLLRKGLQ